MLATDRDDRDNTITYDIIYETVPTEEEEEEEGSSSASGSGSGEDTPTTNPAVDRFNFSISSEGVISNDKIFPTVAEGEV